MVFCSAVDKYLIDQFAKIYITRNQNQSLNNVILITISRDERMLVKVEKERLVYKKLA